MCSLNRNSQGAGNKGHQVVFGLHTACGVTRNSSDTWGVLEVWSPSLPWTVLPPRTTSHCVICDTGKGRMPSQPVTTSPVSTFSLQFKLINHIFSYQLLSFMCKNKTLAIYDSQIIFHEIQSLQQLQLRDVLMDIKTRHFTRCIDHIFFSCDSYQI